MFLQVHYSVSGQTKPLFPAFLIQPLGLLLLNKQSTKKPEGKWSVKAKFIHLKCGSWPYTIHLGKSLKRPIVRLGGCRNLHIINYYPNYTVFKVTIFLWQLLAYVEQLYINMLEVWVFVCVCVCVSVLGWIFKKNNLVNFLLPCSFPLFSLSFFFLNPNVFSESKIGWREWELKILFV